LTGTSAINGTGNALANVLAGNGAVNTLTGGAGDDRLDGKAGADKLIGGLGNDTYVVDNASDAITESAGQGTDTVESSRTWTLGANLENLLLTGSSAFNGTGNTASNLLRGNTANNTLTGGTGVDLLEGGAGNDTLSDATASDRGYFNGGTGTDALTGGAGAELFIGGTGNDTLSTGAGADVIAFNLGDGQDAVSSPVGQDNTLSLGGGIRYADLSLSKSGSNLVVSVGVADRITLNNWYAATPVRSVLSLQMIAEAMADFDDNGADPLRDDRIETFDFAGLAGAFDAALVANPGLTSWAITNALTSFHLSGSDTAALGGDLAYQYGRYGNLANVGLVGAQNVLNNAQFGAQAQALQSAPGLQEGVVRLT
jgi:Ca2+-binding RTX toxin-like protein